MSLQLFLRVTQENHRRDQRLDAARAAHAEGVELPVAAADGSALAQQAANLSLLLDAVYIECRGQTAEAKVAHKRARCLAELQAFAAAFLAAPEHIPHHAVAECAIWLADCGEWVSAIALTDACLAKHQPMPERFTYGLDWTIASELLKDLQAQFKCEKTCDFRLRELLERVRSGAWQAHHSVLEGALKLTGFCLEEVGERGRALATYRELQALTGSDAGVKTRVEKLAKALADTQPAAASGDAS